MKDFLTEDRIIKIGNSGLYMFRDGNKKYTKQELSKFLNEREKELQESLKNNEDKSETKPVNKVNNSKKSSRN
jgi:hypothetical protein